MASVQRSVLLPISAPLETGPNAQSSQIPLTPCVNSCMPGYQHPVEFIKEVIRNLWHCSNTSTQLFHPVSDVAASPGLFKRHLQILQSGLAHWLRDLSHQRLHTEPHFTSSSVRPLSEPVLSCSVFDVLRNEARVMEGLRSLLIDSPFIHDILKLNVQPADSDYAVDIRSPSVYVSTPTAH